jgi:hypothetical protein
VGKKPWGENDRRAGIPRQQPRKPVSPFNKLCISRFEEQMMKVLENVDIRKILLKRLVDLGYCDDLNENSRFLRIK